MPELHLEQPSRILPLVWLAGSGSIMQAAKCCWCFSVQLIYDHTGLRAPANLAVTSVPALCSGVLYEADKKPASAPAGPVHTFIEDAEISLPQWALSKWCPRIVVSLLTIKQIGTFTVGLSDVADVILGNLGPGTFSSKRVGLKRTLAAA
jgi:hypothetical protein